LIALKLNWDTIVEDYRAFLNNLSGKSGRNFFRRKDEESSYLKNDRNPGRRIRFGIFENPPMPRGSNPSRDDEATQVDSIIP
jgi:hypothetical protein